MPSRKNSSGGKVRYAVVGLGHIAQVAILPAFKNAKDSILTGLFSGSGDKLRKVAEKYKVQNTWSYDEYDDCLKSGEVDAVYIALPNDMHREFTVRAARAGRRIIGGESLAVAPRSRT